MSVLLATFLLTVLVDLTVAVQVGIVLAAFLFIRRMAEVTNVETVTREFREGTGRHDAPGSGRCRAARDPGRRRGVRDQRPVLLRGRREAQGRSLLRGAAPEGLRPAHAQRPRDRRDGDPGARRPLRELDQARRGLPDRGTAGSAAGRARAGREGSTATDGRTCAGDLDEALERAREILSRGDGPLDRRSGDGLDRGALGAAGDLARDRPADRRGARAAQGERGQDGRWPASGPSRSWRWPAA